MRAICIFLVLWLSVPGCCEFRSGSTVRDDSIAVYDLDGSKFDLWAQRPHATKVAIFVRMDCPIANRYAPEIRRLDEKYRNFNVEFFLVYVDPRESNDAIRKHMQEYGHQSRGLRDPRHSLVKHTGAAISPEAVVFDRDRKIAYLGRIDDLYESVGKSRNAATTHELADAIEATIAGRAVAVPRTKAVGCLIADLKE
jgi:hypothetical protein